MKASEKFGTFPFGYSIKKEIIDKFGQEGVYVIKPMPLWKS